MRPSGLTRDGTADPPAPTTVGRMCQRLTPSAAAARIEDVPKSRGRKTTRKANRVSRRRVPTSDTEALPPIDGIVETVVRGGTELLEVEEPF